MANARLTTFLVNLCMTDGLLEDFKDAGKRLKMLQDARPELSREAIDAFSARNEESMFDLIKTQQAGTGHARVKDANRLVAKARKIARKKR
jgi:hypothetical protein